LPQKFQKKKDCQKIRICFSSQKKDKVGVLALFNHGQLIKKVFSNYLGLAEKRSTHL
jgi:hypothetical protein